MTGAGAGHSFRAMPLNLIKLCVGADSVDDLAGWIGQRRALAESEGRTYEQFHTTRQMPRRRDELLRGGSLYWVVKGSIQCRQRIVDLRPVEGEDGITRCKIILEPVIIRVRNRRRGPFQGWRYLKGGDAPPDLKSTENSNLPPPEMEEELSELGLI